jgi:hypothetical protein
MQDEGVNVGAKLGDDELHALRHETRDEMNISAEAIELGHHNRALRRRASARAAASCGRRIESIGALAGLDLLEHADNLETLRSDEAAQGCIGAARAPLPSGWPSRMCCSK